jgi:flagellar biosynthesis/type III secretory pathway protein FliH
MTISKLNLGSFVSGKPADQSKPAFISAPKNFKFFAQSAPVEEVEFTKTDLNKKNTEGYTKGLDEGYSKGKDEVTKTALALEQTTKATVDVVANNLKKFLDEFDEQKKKYMRDMAKVTIIAIQKIAEKTIKENSEEIILQALEKASLVFTTQPEIIFKAKKIILEKIRDKVDNILSNSEFKGKITYVNDETIADGNCVLEWGESGISINAGETLKQIEEIISEYLKSI